MASRRNRPKHKRTESQAVYELENVFKSVDLEGEGKLDKASFSTAMFSLDMSLDDKKMDEVFNGLDGSEKGYVDYEEFLGLLKSGQMRRDQGPTKSLLDAARVMPGSYASTNKSIAQSNLPKSASTPVLSTSLIGSKPRKSLGLSKLDPKKKQVIQRAVIVIKKAAMKNISKDEVMEFLKDKGMSADDIEYAYEKAQEQAMSPDERIRYLKGQIQSKEKEILDNQAFSRHQTTQIHDLKEQVDTLRNVVSKAASTLMEAHQGKFDDVSAPAPVITELNQQIREIRKQMEPLSPKNQDVIKKDLDKLKNILMTCESKRFFHAYLFYSTLPPEMQMLLRSTASFLQEFE